jgi:hypothetical protein
VVEGVDVEEVVEAETGGGVCTRAGEPSNHPTQPYLLSYMPIHSAIVTCSDGVNESMAIPNVSDKGKVQGVICNENKGISESMVISNVSARGMARGMYREILN